MSDIKQKLIVDVQTSLQNAVESADSDSYNDVLSSISEALDTLRTQLQGMVILPETPTEEMIEALYGFYLNPSCDKGRKEAFTAMVNAYKGEV